MQFTFREFTYWRQDNKDYSGIKNASDYVTQIAIDIIEYCENNLKYTHHEALKTSEHYMLLEAKRLNVI